MLCPKGHAVVSLEGVEKTLNPTTIRTRPRLRRKIKIQGGDISWKVMTEATSQGPRSSLLHLNCGYQSDSLGCDQKIIEPKNSQAKCFTAGSVFGWQRAGAVVPRALLGSKVNAECSTCHICYVPRGGRRICGFATGSSEQTRSLQYSPEQQLQEDHLKLHKALIWTPRQVWYRAVGHKPKCPMH